jgi:FKBP-type peptidyl-prolyl cis-trans isomerase FkpA
MKIKNLIFIAVLGLIIISCNKSKDKTVFDAEAQAEIDNTALVEYLQTHYLNENDDAIWTITNGEISLMDQVISEEVMKNDIKYTLYYLVQNEGAGLISPSRADSVLTTYTGMLLDSTVFDSRSSIIWFSLTDVVDGWGYAFSNFKGGNKVINADESFYYEDFGEGYIFIPSGLAYGNVPQSIISENSPLVFKITLNEVNFSDHDNDGVLSKDEDIDGDGNVKNDDTDGDGIMNYLDTDDDGDGILTKDEDIANYLDKDK